MKPKAEDGKKKTGVYLIITLGSVAGQHMDDFKAVISKYPQEMNAKYFALDTSEEILKLQEADKEINAIVVGRESLNGTGSGMDIEAGLAAFEESKAGILAAMQEGGQPILGAVILAVIGPGGTASSLLVPMVRELRDELEIQTVVFVLEPSEANCELGTDQKKVLESVLDDISMNNINVFVIQKDWGFRVYPRLTESVVMEKIFEEVAKTIFCVFGFWVSPAMKEGLGGRNMRLIDPRDLDKNALKLGGRGKTADCAFEITDEDEAAIEKRMAEVFQSLMNFSLYSLDNSGHVSLVYYQRKGLWTMSHIGAFQKLLFKEYGDMGYKLKWEKFEQYHAEQNHPEIGSVTLYLSTRNLHIAPATEEFIPETAASDLPPSVAIQPAISRIPYPVLPAKPNTQIVQMAPRTVVAIKAQPPKAPPLTPELKKYKEEFEKAYGNKADTWLEKARFDMIVQRAAGTADPFAMEIIKTWGPKTFVSVALCFSPSYVITVEEIRRCLTQRLLGHKDVLFLLNQNASANDTAQTWNEFLFELFTSPGEQREFPQKLRYANVRGSYTDLTPDSSTEVFSEYLSTISIGSQEKQKIAEELYVLKLLFGKFFVDLWKTPTKTNGSGGVIAGFVRHSLSAASSVVIPRSANNGSPENS